MTARPLLPLVALLLAVAGCSPKMSPPADPAFAAVESHLEPQLDSGEFEVVKWWPPKPLPDFTRGRIAYFDRQIEIEQARRSEPGEENDTIRRLKERREELASAPPPVVARLKYRTENRAGAKELRDEVFRFDGQGKLVERIDGERDDEGKVIWEYRDEYFPG